MKKIYFYLIIFLTCSTWGCQQLDTTPADRESDITYWDKQESAIQTLNSCYPDLYDASRFIYSESLSDNSYTKGAGGAYVGYIAEGSYDPSNALITQVWNARYAGIRRCNTLLDNIENVQNLDLSLKSRYMAEARAIRAYHYFILMSNYGDVPLVETQISISESREIARAPREQVLQFILSELEEAALALPNSYDDMNKGRITKGAAMALKARVLLCESNWSELATVCDQLINQNAAGSFSLFPNYLGLFKTENKDNSEVILNVEFMPIMREHTIQYYLIPPSLGGYSSIAPSQELVDSYLTLNGLPIANDPAYNENSPYDNRDPRLDATVIRDGSTIKSTDGSLLTINTAPNSGDDAIDNSSNATSTGYYVNKFYDQSARDLVKSGSNLILIRYADVLLMYAEAKNELGELDAAVWTQTIQALRQRAGFTAPEAIDFPAAGQDELRSIIRNERRSELAMEGLRLMDLRRWRTAEVVMNGWLHGMKTDLSTVDNGYKQVDQRVFDINRDYLWPVPQSERDLNKNLTQNPNW